VGFVANNCLKHSITDFNPISPIICTIRIAGAFFNYSVINVRAPMEEKLGCEDFYNALDNAYVKSSRHNIKVVIRDFSAKVGRDCAYKPNVGTESLHEESNDNGLRLVDFTISWNMVIGVTLYLHNKIHKGAWKSPDQ
jgi:hypothetical protein